MKRKTIRCPFYRPCKTKIGVTTIDNSDAFLFFIKNVNNLPWLGNAVAKLNNTQILDQSKYLYAMFIHWAVAASIGNSRDIHSPS